MRSQVEADSLTRNISFTYHSTSVGKKWIRVNAVGDSNLVHSWVVLADSTLPPIRKTFPIRNLEVGAKQCVKNLPYQNAYNMEKNYIVLTSHPHLLRIEQPTLCLAPYQETSLTLVITPPKANQVSKTMDEVYMFINDAGRVEDCLKFELYWKHHLQSIS